MFWLRIPREWIFLATFPGVMVHEFSHWLCCRLTGTRVIEVCWFNAERLEGYVVHEAPPRPWHHLLICAAPLLINSLLAILLIACTDHRIFLFDLPCWQQVLTWLAFTIAVHALPSGQDADNAWRAMRAEHTPGVTRMLGYPIAGLLHLAAGLQCIDLAYAACLLWGVAPALCA